MANQFTGNTLSGTYNDDYNVDDNYHQILFNSGRSLQARELTQLQTLVYGEMGRFGANIFKEGAAVTGGGTNIDNNYQYVKIASTNQGGQFSDIPLGTIFQNPITNVSAQVVQVIAATGDDPALLFDTLFVQYINSGNGALSTAPVTFGDGETLADVSGNGYSIVTESPNATGYGVKFTVAEGDFFVLGRFVHTSEQSIILSPYTQNSVDKTVGFKVVQEVVTVNDTNALYDNSGGTVNTASPGADRLRIRLVLTTEDKVTSDETFLFIAEIENGKIVKEIDNNEQYGTIRDMIAERTKEESGDYIVSPFILDIGEDAVTDSSISLNISDGIAYVNGYRVETASSTSLNVPKPTGTGLIENVPITIQYGNYFECGDNRGLPNLDYENVKLWDATSGGGTDLGTCRIRAVERDGATFKVYVFDVKIQPTRTIRDAKSIGTGSTDYFNINLIDSKAQLIETENNDLLFPLPETRPESLDGVSLTSQSRQQQTASTNVINLTQLPENSAYVDKNLWTVGTTLAAAEDVAANIVISNGGRDCQITGLDEASGVYEVLAYVQKTATIKSKTVQADVIKTGLSPGVDSAGGFDYWGLGDPDIYQIDSVRQDNSSGIDISSMFLLDDGQRDNFYADGRLILRDGHTNPGDIYVRYKKFNRGTGDFYCVNSYNIAYKDIPSHILKDGSELDLTGYLDFRPDENDRISNDTSYTNIMTLPRSGSTVTADTNYYLPRADKLIITPEGELQYLMGEQAATPKFKETPANTMELYKIIMYPNTLDENDLEVTPVENRRYTMADIADLDKKIDDLEAYTSLSLLELDQRLTAALDSDGLARIECGSLVDDCSDQTKSDTSSPDFRAALDPESRLIRPSFEEKNLRLIYDDTLSNGVVKKGDNVYLAHDSAAWSSQLLASRSTNINPYGKIDNVGTMRISPNADEWKESQEAGTKALSGSNKLTVIQAYLWNNHSWNWQGRDASAIKIDYAKLNSSSWRIRSFELKRLEKAYSTASSTFLRPSQSNGTVSRIVVSDTLRSVVGNRIVDLCIVPWVRSRKVFFKAQGLTPNTKFTPFFDGKDVSVWCREESTFVQWSDRNEDIGNKYTTVTEHPAGTTPLIADANGEVIGSFFIPNIKPQYEIERTETTKRKWYGKKKRSTSYSIRFRAGIREFKLLDINVNDWNHANSKAFAYYTVAGALDKDQTRSITLTNPIKRGRGSKFTTKELKKIVDNIGLENLAIVDPRLSGLYGPDETSLSASALTSLSNNKTLSKVISDYIDVNQNQFSNVLGSKPASTPMNPLAQTFYVDNAYGVTLTKLDLFFKSKPTDSNIPVSIHIRPAVAFKPSEDQIVTDSQVYMNSSSVVTTSSDEQLVTIKSRPTSFVFEEPIYLKPYTMYAIVVTSQSTEYELYTAKTREPVIGAVSRSIVTQSGLGSLYLPQNGKKWSGSHDQDLMYKLTRAKFGTAGGANGSVILRNADVPATLLPEASLRTTLNVGKVYVSHKNHGLHPGDGVQLDSATAVGGITAATLNTVHQVDSADINGYTFTAATNATSTAVGGGNRILSQGNIPFSTINPHIETVIPNYTSIGVSAKLTSGRSISGTETRFVQPGEYTSISLKQNVEYDEMKAIYNASSEDSDIAAGASSVYFKMDLKSANDYVSPIVDLQRSSLITINNLIDNDNVSALIHPAASTLARSATDGAVWISTPVTIGTNGVGIEVKADVMLPATSAVVYELPVNIYMYYRTCSANENIYDQSWVYKAPTTPYQYSNSHSDFNEQVWLPGDRGGTLKAFQQVQIKFVMKSVDNSKVPLIKNYRLKCLAV
jgi:hypothetical protein